MPDNMPISVLIVDHDPRTGRETLAFLRERGYDAFWVNDGEKAANHLERRHVDALVTEWSHGRIDGLKLMALVLARNPEGCVVLITDVSGLEQATAAMGQGAHDLQTRPLNLAKLDAVIKRAALHQQLTLDQVELKKRVDEQFGLGSLIGRSQPMAQVYRAVRQAGMMTESVLISGAPGTGKGLISQAIHQSGPLRDGPLVRLDCAALPGEVLAQALFGESGGQRGALALADGGSLVLHQADRMSAAVQARLLAWLDTGRFLRGGDEKPLRSSARLMATTHHRVSALAGMGVDSALVARLGRIVIDAPALRNRAEDIPLLIAARLAHAGESAPTLSQEALDVLMRYDWPGNVRELENVVAGMLVAARPGAMLGVGAVPATIRRAARPVRGEIRIPVGVPMTVIERAAIEETMRHCDYDKVACAKVLGIGLRTLYRRLDEYDREDQGVAG